MAYVHFRKASRRIQIQLSHWESISGVYNVARQSIPTERYSGSVEPPCFDSILDYFKRRAATPMRRAIEQSNKKQSLNGPRSVLIGRDSSSDAASSNMLGPYFEVGPCWNVGRDSPHYSMWQTSVNCCKLQILPLYWLFSDPRYGR